MKIWGKELDKLHVLGGGSLNSLLSQFWTNAMQIPVIAGPSEATSIGNAMVQLISIGEIQDHLEARKIVMDSIKLECYEPQDEELWNEQFERYQKEILGKNIGPL